MLLSLFWFFFSSFGCAFQLCFSLCCLRLVEGPWTQWTASLVFYGLVTGTFARQRLRLSYAVVLYIWCRSFSHSMHRFHPPMRSPRPKWPVPTYGISGIWVWIPNPRSRQNAGDLASQTNRTRSILISAWLLRKYRCTSQRFGVRDLRRWIPRNQWRPSRVVLQISIERESFSTCSIEVASSPFVFFFGFEFNFLGFKFAVFVFCWFCFCWVLNLLFLLVWFLFMFLIFFYESF